MAHGSSRGSTKNVFTSSNGFLISPRGYDASEDGSAQEAIHRLYLATNDFKLGDASNAPCASDSTRRVARALPGMKSRVRTFSDSCQPPELLPPVSLEPPMSLEEIVASSQWQRTRGVPQSLSEPCLGSKYNAPRGGTWLSHKQQSISGLNVGSIASTSVGFPRRRPPGTAEVARGQKVAGGPPVRAQASALVPAARQVLLARDSAREARFRMPSTFTDGRRRVALMRCMERLKHEKIEPTLGEVSKRLMQEGWQMKEVKEHLLLLADDTNKWNVRSGRELDELCPKQSSHLPAIMEACGGSENVGCAQKVRHITQGFRRDNAGSWGGGLDVDSH